MGCKHRFKDELIPDWKIEYLFVGTFNPEWSNDTNNANYFYGRYTNDFWYIMPQLFGKNSLMDKKYRTSKEYLKTFLENNKIGLTDLIIEIRNINENNPNHKKDVLSFKDRKIENYEIDFNTNNIKKIIDNNENLKGVFFTRNIEDQSKICDEWKEIKNYCNKKNIHTSELITPSRGYRRNGYNRDKKLKEWKEVILK